MVHLFSQQKTSQGFSYKKEPIYGISFVLFCHFFLSFGKKRFRSTRSFGHILSFQQPDLTLFEWRVDNPEHTLSKLKNHIFRSLDQSMSDTMEGSEGSRLL